MRIYVGNLSYNITEEELRQEFATFGELESVNIITDRNTGRPRGFAFVEMPTKAEADAAIAALNGKMVDYRTLVVNEARPRTESGGSRPFSGGGRREGGGFGRRDDRRRRF